MLRLTCLTKVQCFSGSGAVPSGSSLTLPLQQQREASFNLHLLALHKAHCRDIVHFVKLKLCSSMYKSLRWVNPLRESSRPFLQCRLHVRMSLRLFEGWKWYNNAPQQTQATATATSTKAPLLESLFFTETFLQPLESVLPPNCFCKRHFPAKFDKMGIIRFVVILERGSEPCEDCSSNFVLQKSIGYLWRTIATQTYILWIYIQAEFTLACAGFSADSWQ